MCNPSGSLIKAVYHTSAVFSTNALSLIHILVFGVAFQHRFQNDALRASRNDFRCRYQFHAVPLQLGLVPGDVYKRQ